MTPAKGNRKHAAVMSTLRYTMTVVGILTLVALLAPADVVTALVIPVCTMWGAVASASIASFNGANAAEHLAQRPSDIAYPNHPTIP